MTIDAHDKVLIWLKLDGGLVPLNCTFSLVSNKLNRSRSTKLEARTVRQGRFNSQQTRDIDPMLHGSILNINITKPTLQKINHVRKRVVLDG